MSPRAIAITVAYDGAPFHGFALQPGLSTVQGELETALSTVCRRDVETVGAGRTDAGVHARGQVVSFPDEDESAPEAGVLLRSVNGLLRPNIAVTDVRFARYGFSARHDAVSREYRYRVVSGSVPPIALRDHAWWVKSPLDIDVMRTAAKMLCGEHDFASFCVTLSAEGRSTVRTVEDIDVMCDVQLGEECVTFTVSGRGFLHSMVRIVVGTLVEIGAGKRDPGSIEEALDARRRSTAGQTAPPGGLTLWHVSYPGAVWL
jgi:tRNA pseudouridine38-40 synthase